MDLKVSGIKIMAIFAHPDDVDFASGGSIAKWASEGAIIDYLVLTDGSKGHEDVKLLPEEVFEIRKKEEESAAKLLGVRKVYFTGFPDGELTNSSKVRYQIVKKIRQLRPDIVLTTDPTFMYNTDSGFVNHTDHRVAGQVAIDSVFPFARNARTFPQLFQAGLKPHKVAKLLLINFSNSNLQVNVTDFIDQKIKALEKHKSQFDDVLGFKERMRTQIKENGGKYFEKFVLINLH